MKPSDVSPRLLLLALGSVPGLGGRSLARIATRNELLGLSPKDFLKLSPEALIEDFGLRTESAHAWTQSHQEALDSARILQDKLDADSIRFVTPIDASYPTGLELMDRNPPGVLFLHGNERLFGAKTFAVLSSRKTHEAGLVRMEQAVEEGVLEGEVLVAGHDTPEYQRSAVVPLRWGAPRILVLDQGFYKALGHSLKEEPFRIARLWRHQFDPSTDLVVSTIHPLRDFFPSANAQRDRLIGGLARRLDFVCPSPGGNMEKVAKSALKAGKSVRVWTGSRVFSDLIALGARELA
mgnify:CR=1 FL=1